MSAIDVEIAPAIPLFLALVYALLTLYIYVGTLRLNYQRTTKLPHISILVAVKNEDQTLRECISSLLRLDYPSEKLEVLLINDRSTDRTPRIIDEFLHKSKLIRRIDVAYSIPGLSGKANAIAQGMEHCVGDLILITDGDCRVPQSWAKVHASYYEHDVGLVGGFTLLDERHDATSLFGKVQSLDWAYLLSIGSGAIGMQTPLSVLGNNFSFRRQAYEEVGGYRNMDFTIIEDFALMKTLLQKTSWKVRYPIDAEMLVYSHPMSGLREFYHQRKRWSAGGKEVGLYGKFLMFIAVLVHILLPITPLVTTPFGVVASTLLVLSADFALLWRTTGLIGRRDLLFYFPIWEPFYFLYTVLFTPVLLLPTRVTWKEISYSWKLNWKIKRMEGN
ncbi:glycosyltransferase [bacterium]|nr:glycosyltransferase [bacterium]